MSNPADGPSRLDLSWCERQHAEQTSINWELLRHHLNIKGERPEGDDLAPFAVEKNV